MELKEITCKTECYGTSPHKVGQLRKRDVDTELLHVRRRRRPLDRNGGCHFPLEESFGWTFSKTQVCDEPEISGLKQGCCLTGSLNKVNHNDFKAGWEDEYEGGYIGSCDMFELGDISNVYLDGIMVADHTGKKILVCILAAYILHKNSRKSDFIRVNKTYM